MKVTITIEVDGLPQWVTLVGELSEHFINGGLITCEFGRDPSDGMLIHAIVKQSRITSHVDKKLLAQDSD